MALDTDTVRRIAHLARLKVPEDELGALADELSNILTWVEQLGEVDTEDVPPMTSVVAMSLPMRDDVVTDGGIAEQVTANAPDAERGFYAVPKVVE
jgi:aspartyl-tRNA(Asn)/glutamyl-tRNA(Gln) amidotransferase subunit C